MSNLLFYLGFSMLVAHELDAVMHSEWKLLYGLRSLPEDVAANAFIALHVPLVSVLLWLTHHELNAVHDGARLLMALFFMVHAGLHFRLRDRPNYPFTSSLSNVLIYGAGVLGLLYCAIFVTTDWSTKLL